MTVDSIIRNLGLDPDYLEREGYYALVNAKWTLKDLLNNASAEDRESIEDAIEYLERWIEVERGTED
jgi:hypothetical protein